MFEKPNKGAEYHLHFSFPEKTKQNNKNPVTVVVDTSLEMWRQHQVNALNPKMSKLVPTDSLAHHEYLQSHAHTLLLFHGFYLLALADFNQLPHTFLALHFHPYLSLYKDNSFDGNPSKSKASSSLSSV